MPKQNMNIQPTIPVTIRTRDLKKAVTFRVFTEEEKAACESAGYNAEDLMQSTEVDGSGQRFEVVRADGAKIWERKLSRYDY